MYGSQEKWLEFFAVWVRRLAHGGYGKLRGAKRVLHEVKGATMERTGMFINCEDGLQIPW